MEQGSEEMRGMCHCGTVKLKVRLCEGAIEDAHRCNCSICLKKGIIMVMALVDGGLEVVEGKDKLTLYKFNTGSAKHYFCSVCGIYTHHQTRSDPDKYAVNAAILEGLDTSEWNNIYVVNGRYHPKDRIEQ